MAIEITAYEQAQLAKQDYLIRPLAGAQGADKSTYHNPITGQEFENLPVDPRSLQLYTRVKGWRLGPASDELRAKWAAGEAERKAADDRMVESYRAKAPLPVQEIPGFNEAVAVAVAQVLKQLGVEVPSSEQTSGASAETDTKLIVSDAPPGESSEQKG